MVFKKASELRKVEECPPHKWLHTQPFKEKKISFVLDAFILIKQHYVYFPILFRDSLSIVFVVVEIANLHYYLVLFSFVFPSKMKIFMNEFG